jgi:hypothetical protein
MLRGGIFLWGGILGLLSNYRGRSVVVSGELTSPHPCVVSRLKRWVVRWRDDGEEEEGKKGTYESL